MTESTLEYDQEDRSLKTTEGYSMALRAQGGGWFIYMNIEITKNREITSKLVEWKQQCAQEEYRKPSSE